MSTAPSAGRLEGLRAVVAGPGSGIARAIAHRLASEGARVSLLGRRAAALEETARDAEGTSAVLPCDVRDAGATRAAMAAAAAAHGPIHVVVANAGVGGPNGPGFQPGDQPDRFDDLVATNLSGTYHTFRGALDHLAEDGGAPRHLVAVASILARIGVMGYSGYCASKAGVTGLCRALAAELAPRDIQVNAVAPGWVETDMALEGLDGMAAGMGITRDEAHALAMREVPLGRMGQPEEIAGMVAWLVSADARGVTGQTLDMNGGAFML
ncbi:MAG: SDR family NAD(P)-dependent oxidoreductase [Planctomycetota bacterium]|nr:SDR family NAD(P)-dependent oxidoreductase [Planctomycetota bacterium]